MAGGSSNIVISANGTNCAWTAVSNSGFIQITGGSSGAGNGIVTYTVAANTNTLTQTGSITAAGQTYTITEAAPSCNVAPTSTTTNFSAAGGSGTVDVAANGTNCAWTAVSHSSLITITAGSSGTGNGVVSYTVAPNIQSFSRGGTMTVAGQTFTVTQAANLGPNCQITLSTTTLHLRARGGNKTVRVKTGSANCDWSAASNDPFITITSSLNSTGNGTVRFTVPGNTNATPISGTMTIAGQTVTVNQDAGGCAFSLSPRTGRIKAAGGPGVIRVRPSLNDCAWSAVSDNAFITIVGNTNGVGRGSVGYSVAPNTSTTPLTGSITVGGQTFTLTEAGAR